MDYGVYIRIPRNNGDTDEIANLRNLGRQIHLLSFIPALDLYRYDTGGLATIMYPQ